MKKFVFRLQAVLDLRLRAERQAQVALAAARQRVAEAEAQIALLAARRHETLALPPEAPFEARVAARTYADALTRQAADLGQQRHRLCAEAQARQGELAQAAGERRAVEKLRERARAEYQAQAQRQEQILLDELGSARHEHARRQGHG